MSRRSKKGPYVEPTVLKKVVIVNAQDEKENIRTWSRRRTIFREFVGLTFEEHNGKQFINVYVTDDMVGHKLGEFSPTRTYKGHTGNRLWFNSWTSYFWK